MWHLQKVVPMHVRNHHRLDALEPIVLPHPFQRRIQHLRVQQSAVDHQRLTAFRKQQVKVPEPLRSPELEDVRRHLPEMRHLRGP